MTDEPGRVGSDPALLLPACIARWAATDPRRPFLAEVTGRTMSYGECVGAIGRWATLLGELGVGAGDRVASFLPPSIQAHLLWLAAAQVGAVEVAVNAELEGPLLSDLLADAAPALCVVRPAQAHLVPAGAPALVVAPGEDPAAGLPPAQSRGARPGDPACVIYTSGTTGSAKGVVVSWGQIASTLGRIPRAELGPGDAVYAPWPMFHVTGRTPLASMADVGGRVVLRERLSVAAFWSDVVEFGCTSTTVGPVAPLLMETEVPAHHGLRHVFMAPRGDLTLNLQQRLRVKVIGNYGSTEAGFPILNPAIDAATAHLTGWLRPGYEGRLVDGEDDVPDGVAGELWIRPPVRQIMFSGYLGIPGDPLTGGWYRTGDVMVRRPGGAFEFVDRLHDTIRRFGETISATAVESIVLADPGVLECAVVRTPSDVAGEEVLLVVVPRDPDLDPASLYARLEGRLPRHSRPAYVAVRDRLPKTSTGKVPKHELDMAPGDPAVWRSPAAVASAGDGRGPHRR